MTSPVQLDQPPVASPAQRVGGLRLGIGLVRAMRPRQWVKNLLVVAAPLAAGQIEHLPTLAATGVAFVAFCLAASGGYLINDTRDVDADRLHPTKRYRPIAAGVVPVPVALAAGVTLVAGSLAVAFALGRPMLGGVLCVYVATTVCYSLYLKHEPVLDLAVVSSGFLLRAIAGGVASHLPLSRWFLIVASFGSLYMVAGKRYAEFVAATESGVKTRRSLAGYTATYLRFVWSLSAAITILAYCLWAFEVGAGSRASVPWGAISVAPFVLGLLRYALDVDAGRAGAPEEVVLGDRKLLICGAVWLLTFSLGVFNV